MECVFDSALFYDDGVCVCVCVIVCIAMSLFFNYCIETIVLHNNCRYCRVLYVELRNAQVIIFENND